MLKFKIFEIPEGQSKQNLNLSSEELDLGDIPFQNGAIEIEFYRTLNFIRTKFTVQATVQLLCDRSLEAFDFTVKQNYEVLFKTQRIEESADELGAIRNFDHANMQIDLAQDVRDTILLNLPTKKLHPRFLDEDGNPAEALTVKFGETAAGDDDSIDPRWAALKELKK